MHACASICLSVCLSFCLSVGLFSVGVAVTDADCAGVQDVKGGLPASGYSWPLAGSFERIYVSCMYICVMYVYVYNVSFESVYRYHVCIYVSCMYICIMYVMYV